MRWIRLFCHCAESRSREEWKADFLSRYGMFTGEAWITYPGEPKMSGNGDVSLLTINAIDGSVIDLDRGY